MPAPPLRCLAVWLTATAGTVALVDWLVTGLLVTGLATGTRPADRFDEALVRLAAVVALLCAGWLWCLVTAVVAEVASGGASVSRGVPSPLRRAVLAACGVAVVAGLAVPAPATPGGLHRDRRPAAALAGLPYPDRAVAPPAPVVDVLVVRPGDTLWDLASADLGAGAAPADIDDRWREIYALNRGVIGPDPDLIQPAQRLRLPAQQ